ncbi:MAG: CsgG/HfaB family protein [Xanthomonadaceae bacterium]|nr:CsgG/HfaB family protein [Xanthomonadaceae bacterium]
MNGFRIALAWALLIACGITAAQTAMLPTAPVLKKSIAVDGFDNRSSGNGAGDVQIAERLADQLADALMRTNAFVVLERERSPAAANPYGDPYSADPTYAVGAIPAPVARPAQAIAAQLLIRGTVTDFSVQAGGSNNGLNLAGVRLGASKSVAQVGLIVRLIDTATQQVLASRRVEGKVTSKGMQLGLDVEGYNYEGDSFKETPLGQAGQIAIDDAVRFIADEALKVSYAARVVKVDDQGRAIISCGALSGLASGVQFAVMSVGEALRDPLTDELLGFEQSPLGVVTVERVFDRFAYTTVLADIKAGDIVRLR